MATEEEIREQIEAQISNSDEEIADDDERLTTSWPPSDYKDQLILMWQDRLSQVTEETPLVIFSKSERPDREDDWKDTMTGRILAKLFADFGVIDIPLLIDLPCASNGRPYSWAVRAGTPPVKEALETMIDKLSKVFPKSIITGDLSWRLLGNIDGVARLHYPSEWLRSDKGQYDNAYNLLSARLPGFYSKEDFHTLLLDAFKTDARRASSIANGQTEACRTAVAATGRISGKMRLTAGAREKQASSSTAYMASAKGKAQAKRAAANMLAKRDPIKTKESAREGYEKYLDEYVRDFNWEEIMRSLQRTRDTDLTAYEFQITREHLLERARTAVRDVGESSASSQTAASSSSSSLPLAPKAVLEQLKQYTPCYRNGVTPKPPSPEVLTAVTKWIPLGLTAEDMALISPAPTSAHSIAFHTAACQSISAMKSQKRKGKALAGPGKPDEWFTDEDLESLLIDGSSPDRRARVARMIAGRKKMSIAAWEQFLDLFSNGIVSAAQNPDACESKITKRRRAKDVATKRDATVEEHNAPLRDQLQTQSAQLTERKRARRAREAAEARESLSAGVHRNGDAAAAASSS